MSPIGQAIILLNILDLRIRDDRYRAIKRVSYRSMSTCRTYIRSLTSGCPLFLFLEKKKPQIFFLFSGNLTSLHIWFPVCERDRGRKMRDDDDCSCS